MQKYSEMTLEQKREIRKEKKRRARMSKPLTPEQLKDKRQRERMKDRAALLSIQQIGPDTFRVWGGDNPHVVRVTEGWITCDCEGWNHARNHNCSHVMKYRIVYGDLKK